MRNLLKNARLRFLFTLAISIFILYNIVTNFMIFSNSRLSVLQNTKAVRQSVSIDPKIEKIKRINSTDIEDKTNQQNIIDPGVFNADYVPDKSKGLGVQTYQSKQGVVCNDGTEFDSFEENACIDNGGVSRFFYK